MAAVTQAVLTHEEIAQIIMFTASNNMLTVSVGGRTFWAIPSLVSSTVVVPQTSASGGGDGSNAGLYAGIAVVLFIICVIATLVLMLVIKRNRRLRNLKNPNSIIAVLFSLHKALIFFRSHPTLIKHA